VLAKTNCLLRITELIRRAALRSAGAQPLPVCCSASQRKGFLESSPQVAEPLTRADAFSSWSRAVKPPPPTDTRREQNTAQRARVSGLGAQGFAKVAPRQLAMPLTPPTRSRRVTDPICTALDSISAATESTSAATESTSAALDPACAAMDPICSALDPVAQQQSRFAQR
jgi:hypothetical protein